MAVIGLNPSTADAERDDHTVRRCMGFARREGCGGLLMLNLYTRRCSDPSKLVGSDYHPLTDETISDILGQGEVAYVLCAWGSHRLAGARAGTVLRIVDEAGHMPMCLGTTLGGMPRHPLYVRRDAPILPYRR